MASEKYEIRESVPTFGGKPSLYYEINGKRCRLSPWHELKAGCVLWIEWPDETEADEGDKATK